MSKHPKDPGYFRIRRSRNGQEHITSCNTGYYNDTRWFMQIHHILPVSSLQDAYIDKQLKSEDNLRIIRFCLGETEWNINASHNCIGLPLKLAFVGRNPKRWGGLPCHLVDHNLYTDHMHKDLNKNVWQPALRQNVKCQFERDSLEPQLRGRSDFWRGWLKARGAQQGGTKYCWRNRHNPEMKYKWYIPFSMAVGKPPYRKAPVAWDNLPDSFQRYFKSLFLK